MSRYVIYADGHRPPDIFPRCHIVTFDDASQARVWLEMMEQRLPDGYTVRSQQMDAIRSADETNWQLPEQYAQWIRRFKWGTWDEVPEQPKPEVDGIETSAPRRERKQRAQRPDGYVTITELCAASGIPACEARAMLRASGRTKPDFGWAFAPSEVAEVKKLCGIK